MVPGIIIYRYSRGLDAPARTWLAVPLSQHCSRRVPVKFVPVLIPFMGKDISIISRVCCIHTPALDQKRCQFNVLIPAKQQQISYPGMGLD
jgi:hypothetical protein